MEFKYSTTWNSNIPLHGIQAFYYMEFKHSTTWNSRIQLHGIQVFHYIEFKYSTTWAEWIRKFHDMKLMVPFTTNLKLTVDLTDFQYQVLYFIHTVGSISKYENEIMVSYSITHMPFLCSIAIWLCSDQYRFCFFQYTTKISDLKGRMNRETERKINSHFKNLQELYLQINPLQEMQVSI